MMDYDERKARLTALAAEAAEFGRCGGSESVSPVIPGQGRADAPVVLVGTAPAEAEVRAGRLWAGRAGGILDELLAEAGLARDDIYMTNLLKSPLPAFRRPKMAEVEACRDFLEREIEIVDPKVVTPMGYYPTKALFAWWGLGNPRRDEYHSLYGFGQYAEGRIILPLPNPAALIPAPEITEWARGAYRRLREALDAGE